MTTHNQIGEPFAFWLAQSFLIPDEDHTDELPPLTNTYTFVTGAAIVIVLAIVRLLMTR